MVERLSKIGYYLAIAKAVAMRSICISHKRGYGAIIVVNDAIVSTGYSGPPRGAKHCEVCCRVNQDSLKASTYEECPSCHAEDNCVTGAARTGVKIYGGDIYVYGVTKKGHAFDVEICDRCKRVLLNAGIKKAIIKDLYGYRVLLAKNEFNEIDNNVCYREGN